VPAGTGSGNSRSASSARLAAASHAAAREVASPVADSIASTSRTTRSACVRPFRGGIHLSGPEEKRRPPTLSLFAVAEKASTATRRAAVVARVSSRRWAEPKRIEPDRSTRKTTVSSRSSW